MKALKKYDILASWLDRDIPDLTHASLHNLPPLDDRWKCLPGDDKPIYYEPVDPAICREFVRDQYPWFLHHHATFAHHARFPEVVSFFGWGVQRSTINGHHFHFSKWIPFTNQANFVVDEAWLVLHSPEVYQNLFRARMITRVLQHVDEDTSLIMQNVPAADHSMDRRCVLLTSKIADQETTGILMLGIAPHEEMTKQHPTTVKFVHDVSVYFLVHHQVDDNGKTFLELSLGGDGEQGNDAEDFIFLELAHALFQFEEQVFPHKLVPLD